MASLGRDRQCTDNMMTDLSVCAVDRVGDFPVDSASQPKVARAAHLPLSMANLGRADFLPNTSAEELVQVEDVVLVDPTALSEDLEVHRVTTNSVEDREDLKTAEASNIQRTTSEMEELSGACQAFGTLSRREFGVMIGAYPPKPNSSSHEIENQGPLPHPENPSIEVYLHPSPVTISFSKDEITLRWFSQADDGSFFNVPGSTKFVTECLFDRGIVASGVGAPAFAPVYGGDTLKISSGGRKRKSAKTEAVRRFCSGDFASSADIFKWYVCSWRSSSLHSCQSVLYVVMCSKHIADENVSSIDVQFVWTEGCSHHKEDIDRGIVRKHQQNAKGFNTASGVCREQVQNSAPQVLEAGNFPCKVGDSTPILVGLPHD